MKTGKVVLGTVAGLALGAISAILFAPEKGSATRKQIMDKGDEYVDKLKSMFDDFFNSLTAKFENIKKDAEKFAEKGSAKYDDVNRDVKNAAANLNHDVAADSNNIII